LAQFSILKTPGQKRMMAGRKKLIDERTRCVGLDKRIAVSPGFIAALGGTSLRLSNHTPSLVAQTAHLPWMFQYGATNPPAWSLKLEKPRSDDQLD
jgi:hypothetical protein